MLLGGAYKAQGFFQIIGPPCVRASYGTFDGDPDLPRKPCFGYLNLRESYILANLA